MKNACAAITFPSYPDLEAGVAIGLVVGSPDACRFEHFFMIVDSATDQPIGWWP